MFSASILGPLLFLFVWLLLRRWLARGYRLIFPRKPAVELGERCQCGYPMTQLDLARCPECGRVIGFDHTAEQLGLSEEQLQRIMIKRNASNRV